jgi:hypothetical protein
MISSFDKALPPPSVPESLRSATPTEHIATLDIVTNGGEKTMALYRALILNLY